ncbi:uncharacterized protein LOC100833561 isoform X1 [Brachypodium distachyon]|uniref:HMA domain-containing protein n=1 Tax=Brachypodium distachyon TaxID=15368 RepID=A0A0Q3GJN2_BRADI|nr:uncharacterized protein LOC100833561 isoform X1 [Brachypodium distachyon]XP_010232771.1 uncharacterized protein LOC100833561 isoform X1 [Brachypodium distachyon]KQK11319.1 hypothetical protein BRADI_2g59450v3 [Brachypodium distachyon]|eukprot:XP_010232770.1 uncharacterized protein LOC100833561 isoform X1 [Brachypodium distachyon]
MQEHGGQEDDIGSGCSRRSTVGSDATMGGTEIKLQALRFAEDLSLPSVQVVVMSANMGCSHCRQRVTKVVTKMNAGLLDYMVDFGKKEVTVRGTVLHTKKKSKKRKKHKEDDNNGAVDSSWENRSSSSSSSSSLASNQSSRTLSWFLGCYGS